MKKRILYKYMGLSIERQNLRGFICASKNKKIINISPDLFCFHIQGSKGFFISCSWYFVSSCFVKISNNIAYLIVLQFFIENS